MGFIWSLLTNVKSIYCGVAVERLSHFSLAISWPLEFKTNRESTHYTLPIHLPGQRTYYHSDGTINKRASKVRFQYHCDYFWRCVVEIEKIYAALLSCVSWECWVRMWTFGNAEYVEKENCLLAQLQKLTRRPNGLLLPIKPIISCFLFKVPGWMIWKFHLLWCKTCKSILWIALLPSPQCRLIWRLSANSVHIQEEFRTR